MKSNIIKERIEVGVCPVCAKVTIETKTVIHPVHGEVKICKIHHVDGEEI